MIRIPINPGIFQSSSSLWIQSGISLLGYSFSLEESRPLNMCEYQGFVGLPRLSVCLIYRQGIAADSTSGAEAVQWDASTKILWERWLCDWLLRLSGRRKWVRHSRPADLGSPTRQSWLCSEPQRRNLAFCCFDTYPLVWDSSAANCLCHNEDNAVLLSSLRISFFHSANRQAARFVHFVQALNEYILADPWPVDRAKALSGRLSWHFVTIVHLQRIVFFVFKKEGC